MRMTALSVTSHVLLMTNIPADQPLGGDWTGVVFWSKLNTRRIVSSALNMGLYVAEVPWAYPGSRFTKDFDLTVAWFASYLPRSTTSYFMRVDWETVGRCVNRALHDLEPERSRRLDGLVNIGIDETSYKKDDPELAIVKAAKAKADEIKGSAYMIKVLCFLFDTKYHMHYIISF